jgi:hypothetical protein
MGTEAVGELAYALNRLIASLADDVGCAELSRDGDAVRMSAKQDALLGAESPGRDHATQADGAVARLNDLLWDARRVAASTEPRSRCGRAPQAFKTQGLTARLSGFPGLEPLDGRSRGQPELGVRSSLPLRTARKTRGSIGCSAPGRAGQEPGPHGRENGFLGRHPQGGYGVVRYPDANGRECEAPAAVMLEFREFTADDELIATTTRTLVGTSEDENA